MFEICMVLALGGLPLGPTGATHTIWTTLNPLPLSLHWVLDHIKMWSGTITLDKGFIKILNYVPKEREKHTAKNEPSFGRVIMLRWLIGIILAEIICESSNWQHIQRLKITILGANWQIFRLEKDRQIMFIFYFVYTKHQVSLSCNENKEISVANLMIQ